jgi:hypothetical protein
MTFQFENVRYNYYNLVKPVKMDVFNTVPNVVPIDCSSCAAQILTG